MRLGLDDFKEINEKLGSHVYGNMVLRKTAECIDSCILRDRHYIGQAQMNSLCWMSWDEVFDGQKSRCRK